MTVSCRLLHHGASASSSRNIVTWIKEGNQLVYASHSVINIAQQELVRLANGVEENVWNVSKTLRPSLDGSRTITCLSYASQVPPGESCVTIATGFSDGNINVWRHLHDGWQETLLTEQPSRSITAIDCLWISSNKLILVTASSEGALLHFCTVQEDGFTRETQSLTETAINAVRLSMDTDHHQCLVLLGTAIPRYNKIHVYSFHADDFRAHYAGPLTGHEDWITCFDWSKPVGNSILLASGSQDYRIRLWKVITTSNVVAGRTTAAEPTLIESDPEGEDLIHEAEEEDEEGDSRLQIVHGEKHVTNVFLEALLMGHEDHVTAVKWHPNPKPLYGQSELLISSSMDRTILFWCPGEDGIWTPLTRVGSAGGILGGSIGSTLLGYCNVVVEPINGRSLVGHAYGGALHVWAIEDKFEARPQQDHAVHVKWRATPCVTGHFNGVSDLCWEAQSGDYLLTVSKDQTCRLWAPIRKADNTDSIWKEVARPQVHGYDLATVTSLSTKHHAHLIVTGADEKELRAFDAPRTTVRVLRAVAGFDYSDDQVKRVDRAYIPSLGLTNKASAADGAEEDKNADDEERDMENTAMERMRLPLERDLGAASLWPEVQKLFGHNTELYRLTSTLSARTAAHRINGAFDSIIVASSCKARDPDAASIRLWNIEEGTCLQVLSGHKSTVAAMCFSPSGKFFAASGKDRRLTVWKRIENKFSLGWAKDSAHKRIIWSTHFCPFNDAILASGSRDGCVRIWQVEDTVDVSCILHELYNFVPMRMVGDKPTSVNALAFAPLPHGENRAIVSLGLETGDIELWDVPLVAGSRPSLLLAFDASICHNASVTKLAWKPVHSDDAQLVLASSSLDHGCRIYQITLS